MAVAVVVTTWALRPLWDIDLFWHVAVGRHILAGAIPRTDIFSAVQPEAPWTTFQWGYELLVAGVDRLAGLRGLQLLHAGVIGLAFGLLAAMLARWRGWLAALAVCGVGLLLFEDRIRERPHVFELLFVVALLPVVLERVRVHWAVLVGAVLLWSNLHAVSALWWVALMGVWTLRQLRGPAFRSRLAVLAGGTVAMLAVPATRRGLSGALLSHQAWPSELVPELRSTLAYADEGWWGFIVLGGVALGVLAALRLPREERLLGLGCALAACLMARWAWFAAIPLGLWLARMPARAHAVSVALVLVLIGARSGGRWAFAERFGEVLQPGTFPESACQAMAESGLALATDTTTQWSGYWLYCNPGSTVPGDGRLVFPLEVAELVLRRGEGDLSTFDESVGRWHTVMHVCPTATAPPLDPSRWRMLHQDAVATVWLASPAWPLLEPPG